LIQERRLLYLKGFYYTPDGQPQHKYCLVLKANANDILLVNLPSSQLHFPFPDKNTKAGCIELQDDGMNIYCFLQGIVCTDQNHSFELDTFLYGHWVQDWDMQKYQATCKIAGSIVDCGMIDEATYLDVLNCLANSGDTKRMYKKRIADIVQNISAN
jgi:hypothetical protein